MNEDAIEVKTVSLSSIQVCSLHCFVKSAALPLPSPLPMDGICHIFGKSALRTKTLTSHVSCRSIFHVLQAQTRDRPREGRIRRMIRQFNLLSKLLIPFKGLPMLSHQHKRVLGSLKGLPWSVRDCCPVLLVTLSKAPS